MRFRVTHILAGMAIVFALLAAADFGVVAVCDGWYDLTVEIDSDAAARVSSVSYLAVHRLRMADAVVASIDDHLEFMEHQDSIAPFVIRVGHSHRKSLFRTWGHVQEYSHVVVVLHHADGSRAIHRLPVPHRDHSRRIVVTGKSALPLRSEIGRPRLVPPNGD